jgi:UDP-N-acetylmuramoyl-tripeptide--D-alanyl-D-alanine ligase
MGSLSMAPEAMVTAWSIDTRTMPNGALYIALPGERFDGHDFVGAALAKGAVAAVVKTGAELGVAREAPLIRVEDTLAAMQELARRLRRRMQLTMVGVTGSAGKTSTKETIAALLAPHLRVAKNEGNLNNHIGVPLSLLRFEETAEVGVMEMGMNHAGEIRFLAGIAAPDIGVVTNVGTAHIENFESIEGIAAAKRELIEALPAGGAAVLNADDTRVAALRHIWFWGGRGFPCREHARARGRLGIHDSRNEVFLARSGAARGVERSGGGRGGDSAGRTDGDDGGGGDAVAAGADAWGVAGDAWYDGDRRYL